MNKQRIYTKEKSCEAPKCGTLVNWARYCRRHWAHARYKGGFMANGHDKRPAIIEGDTARIPLGINAKQGYAVVDKEFAYLDSYKWRLHTTGYAIANDTPKTLVKMHHLVKGKPSKGLMVDHENRNRLDNRLRNLRFCTISQNGQNRLKQSNNKSGYKGVYWNTQKGKWTAKLNKARQVYYFGSFESKEEAARAYDEGAIMHFGKYAKLNFSKETI